MKMKMKMKVRLKLFPPQPPLLAQMIVESKSPPLSVDVVAAREEEEEQRRSPSHHEDLHKYRIGEDDHRRACLCDRLWEMAQNLLSWTQPPRAVTVTSRSSSSNASTMRSSCFLVLFPPARRYEYLYGARSTARSTVMPVGRGRGVHGAWRERNVAVLQVLLPGAGYLQVGMAERCRPFMNFDFACDLIRLIGIFIIIL